jgi:hypothetical protein
VQRTCNVRILFSLLACKEGGMYGGLAGGRETDRQDRQAIRVCQLYIRLHLCMYTHSPVEAGLLMRIRT